MISSTRIQLDTRRAVFRAIRWLPLVCCAVLCGCGGKDYTVAPVSGRVTLDDLLQIQTTYNVELGFDDQPTDLGA